MAALAQPNQRIELKGKWYIVDGRRVGKGQFAEVYRAREAVVHVGGSPKSSGATAGGVGGTTSALGAVDHSSLEGHAQGGAACDSDGGLVALKVEREDATLMHEYRVLKALQSDVDGVCKVHDIDMFEGKRIMVMQLLGENLSTLRKSVVETGMRLSWDSTRSLGQEMLKALHQVHEAGYIHRDVKPSNFALGRAERNDNKVYIIDFGLARKYLEDNGWSHQAARENRRFRGSSAYASVNAHEERDLSRRDDLWSLLYVLVEFLVGDLPWRRACADQDKEDVLRQKLECIKHPERLAPTRLPAELLKFSNHLASLEFQAKPNYDQLQRCLGPPVCVRPVYEFHHYRMVDADNTAMGGPSTTASGQPEAADSDMRNDWRLSLKPEAKAVLADLLRLDETQAWAVIASTLEEMALHPGAQTREGVAQAQAAAQSDKPARPEVEGWLLDLAAHAVGLAEKASGGVGHKRRAEVAMR
eukprot:CAMPEP_0114303954 /NCGR_PEP_ID=MMETSP0059-20121206/15512_1 /TAXON_ID=36894 /ORGANISM="Pyramimonas parkeae, Strain CCMP726" /LENGTH=472 /DNA_ID=CAMNT_0001426987 /DNA_START=175 /DNA_END=1593 /DNA_ORIENTATION=-